MPGFTEDSARRIAKSTRWVEDRYRNSVGRAVGLSGGGGGGSRLGITTTAIRARSGKTPGSGSVQPYTFDGATLAAVDVPETVFNWTGTEVASGVWVEYEIVMGWPFLTGQDCSGVAP